MKKRIFVAVAIAFHLVIRSQSPWVLGKNEITGGNLPIIGTSNNYGLDFASNDTIRATITPDGALKVNDLAGDSYRLLYVDATGKIVAGPDGGNGGAPIPSEACFPRSLPWHEGGNKVNNYGSNKAGTCNQVDFLLMANNQPQIYIKTDGRVSLGSSTARGKFHVFEPVTIGPFQGDPANLVHTIASQVDNNKFENNSWVRRYESGSDWQSAALHDGISVDASFQTPGQNTKTWWERRPAVDEQIWGNGSSAYMGLIQGKLWIGANTQTSGSHTDAKLTVDGKIVTKSLFVTIGDWGGWPDYVFSEEYKLPRLNDVEAYYDKNCHLPGIPAEEEILKYGINVGEMNKLLLKKIEELTIYAVQQDKRIEILEKKLESHKK